MYTIKYINEIDLSNKIQLCMAGMTMYESVRESNAMNVKQLFLTSIILLLHVL